MFGMDEIIAKNLDTKANGGDYIDSEGLLVCGKCGVRRENFIDIGGKILKLRCICKCEKEAEEREREAMRIAENRHYSERLTSSCMGVMPSKSDVFASAVKSKPLSICERYALKFDSMFNENIGILMWGIPGSGKTYASACIANSLISRGFTVLVLSVPRIVTLLSGMSDAKERFFDSIGAPDLTVLDDLGAERRSEYAAEIVYNIVDARYRARKPLAVTTNLKLEEMREPQDIACRRIYERILETCAPVPFGDSGMRKCAGKSKLEAAKELLGVKPSEEDRT